MPTGRLLMRRIRDLLRLKFGQGLSDRAIATSLGLGKGSIGRYLRRARDAGLEWPLPADLDDDSLELLLFPAPPSLPNEERVVPDWSLIDKEMRKSGVTRQLLWHEYRTQHPEGFSYTWFCTNYDAWKGRVRPTMRQSHVGGEKVFVDFSGDTIDVIDPSTGEACPAKLFVGTMGASSYTYAEAVASEGLEDWIGAHTRMFTFFGGVPKVVVPDNLKSAVIKPDRHDPGLNRTYAEMAEHYGTAIVPARPYKPRDKAKVEVAVQVAQRWVAPKARYCENAHLRCDGVFAEPEILLAGRAERRDPPVAGCVEHARHAGLRRQPCGSVCDPGPPTSAAAARPALCLCPLETRPGRAGLSCRVRSLLVLGALRADPGVGRYPRQRQYGRGFPPGQARRQSRP